jgi:hypothetical protein
MSNQLGSNPTQISRSLYLAFSVLGFLGTVAEMSLSDYSTRRMAVEWNYLPLLCIVYSWIYTAWGRRNRNWGIGFIGMSICAVFIVEMIILLLFPKDSNDLLWLLFDQFLAIASIGMLGMVVNRRLGIYLGAVVIVLGAFHVVLQNETFMDEYGPCWLVVSLLFVFFIANYRKNLEVIYGKNLETHRDIEAQKEFMRIEFQKNEEALRLLHVRHQQLIEQEQDAFHDSLLKKMVMDLEGPVNGLVKMGGLVQSDLQALIAFFESHGDNLSAQDRSELPQLLQEMQSALNGISHDSSTSKKHLAEMSANRGGA